MEGTDQKIPYVAGPLTELDPAHMEETKAYYTKVADVCQEVLGVRGWAPVEHYDPIHHASYAPRDVDIAEREQVTKHTSRMILTASQPSFGAAIELEMANTAGVPVILLVPEEKVKQKLVSRLLLGNPAVKTVIEYTDFDDALAKLREELKKHT